MGSSHIETVDPTHATRNVRSLGAWIMALTAFAGLIVSVDTGVRAIDPKAGDVLWKSRVEAPAVAMPAVYDNKAGKMSSSPSPPIRS